MSTVTALQAINQQVKRKNQVAQSIMNHLINSVIPSLKDHIKAQSSLEQSFTKYLQLLSKYQDGRTLTPLDAFPGIRTTDTLYNSDEMTKDTTKMKELAGVVNDAAVIIENTESHIMNDLKRALELAQDYLGTSAAIDEAFYDVLEKLDSVYDVGMLAKNS